MLYSLNVTAAILPVWYNLKDWGMLEAAKKTKNPVCVYKLKWENIRRFSNPFKLQRFARFTQTDLRCKDIKMLIFFQLKWA